MFAICEHSKQLVGEVSMGRDEMEIAGRRWLLNRLESTRARARAHTTKESDAERESKGMKYRK